MTCQLCHRAPATGIISFTAVCSACAFPSRACGVCGQRFRPEDVTEAWDDRLGWACADCWEAREARAGWEEAWAHAR